MPCDAEYDDDETPTINTAIEALNTVQDEAFDRIHRLCASLDALWEG